MVESDPGDFDRLTVPSGACGRLDQWLAEVRPELSRSRWQRMIRDGRVSLEDESAQARSRIREGQVVWVDRSALESASDKTPSIPRAEYLPLKVIYEDRAMLVIDKAPGMVVHPGNGCTCGTVVNAALHHCGVLPDLGDLERPGVVHRIDRETSGLLVVAKTVEAGRALQEAFRDRRVEKTYLAVIQGCPEQDAGTIDRPIGRHPVARTRMAEVEGGRNAVTHWEVLRRSDENWSVVKVRIETGRTHQIRVHLSARGHPLLGDGLYGFRPSRVGGIGAGAERVLLHARTLRFPHPETGKPMDFRAPVPGDLRKFFPED